MTGYRAPVAPAPADPWTITTPRIVHDMPETVYHADPVPAGSLSHSGAKVLLNRTPGHYQYTREHPTTSDEFDFGKAAHAHILGTGAEVCVLDFDDWRTSAAKAARDDAKGAGLVPLLARDWRKVLDMADALTAHRTASALLTDGTPEVSMFSQTGDGLWLRARIDWVHDEPERSILTDYKTCQDASPGALARSFHTYGYHIQHPWYLDMWHEFHGLPPGRDAFVFICQEKAAPYAVNVVELDPDAVTLGRQQARQAIDLWATCRLNGDWPTWADQVNALHLPAYAYKETLQWQ